MSNPYDILATGTGSDAEEDGGSITDRRAAGGTDSWSDGLFADYTDEPAQEASWHQLTLDHSRAPFLKNGIPRVCGNNRSKCSRSDHKKVVIVRSDPGFYFALAPITKISKIDGAGGTYKSIAEMAAELRATEARLHQEIQNLATSPGYQETLMAGVSQPAYIAGSPVPDDPISQSIRTMTDQMETMLAKAAADALSLPPPPPKTMFNLTAERLRQTISRITARVGTGGVFGGTTPVSKPGAQGRELAMVEDDVSYEGSLLRATSGLVTAPPHRYSPTRDRAAQCLAWLQEQVNSYQKEAQAADREEEGRRLQEEEDLFQRRADSNLSTHQGFHQQDTPPPTIHIKPQVAALEAQLRSLKAAAAKQAKDDYTDGVSRAGHVAFVPPVSGSNNEAHPGLSCAQSPTLYPWLKTHYRRATKVYRAENGEMVLRSLPFLALGPTNN